MRLARLCSLAFLLAISYVHTLEAQWVPTNGPTIGPFYVSATYSLAGSKCPITAPLYAGTSHGLVFRTSDNGNNWVRTDGRSPASMDTGFTSRNILALALSDSFLFAGTEGAGIFRCAINDTHWVAVKNGLTNLNVWCFMAYADSAGDSALYAGTLGGGVFRSTNNGESWVARNVGLTNLYIGALAFTTNATHQSTIFAGTSWGVHVSSDFGVSWSGPQSGSTGYWVRSIIAVRNTAGDTLLFAGSDGGGAYRSSDNGTNWTAANTGLPPNSSIHVLTANDTVIFAGIGAFANRSLFYSLDDGAHWEDGSNGLLSSCGDVRSLAVSDTNLFAGIDGCEPSVWRRPLSEMLTDVEDRDMQIPSGFSLEQNFPNPFNPTTTIGFDLPEAAFVTLKVYNVLGEEVAVLVDGLKQAGKYQTKFHGDGLSSGIYLYKLVGDGKTFVRKMILAK